MTKHGAGEALFLLCIVEIIEVSCRVSYTLMVLSCLIDSDN